MMRKSILIAILCLSCTCAMQAKIALPSFISDNMVLQQQTDAAIWGKAEPGRKVVVKPSWSKKGVSCTADAETGRWLVRIPTPAAGGPYEISISDGDRITLSNILIGEVWFCTGQSNMGMPVCGFNASPVQGSVDAILAADPRRPLRTCRIEPNWSLTPTDESTGSWQTNNPDAVSIISATSYFFADVLQKTLGVPVGIIVSSAGGSPVEAWLPADYLEKNFPEVDLGTVKGEHPMVCEYIDASLLYNAMLCPIFPYTFGGFIWYQGEGNRDNPDDYIVKQTEYARLLREKFQVPQAPFYYVQIVPWTYSNPDDWCSGYFNEAQQKCLETIPNSRMVVTCDLADESNIHPSRKREVGQRLAMLALQHEYGFTAIKADAPLLRSVEYKEGKAYVSFSVDELSLAPLGKAIEGFELAGEDRVFHVADAQIDPSNYERVIVESPEVPEPVAVRYAFRNLAKAGLFNNFGIPAAPFRTDDWKL